MRKIAFGYSTHCNIKCEHCVAASEHFENKKYQLDQAKKIIKELAGAGVNGISFTAGEPLLYLDDIAELVALCQTHNIYTRIVSNGFWAQTSLRANACISRLKENGLSQMRLSSSRWHHKNIPRENLLHAAQSCVNNGLDYFISFITDFSDKDDDLELFLRKHKLRFFPEPIIFSGRAGSFRKTSLRTDYQANRCPMNPYLAPDHRMYACCDAGSHFTKTNFFYLGNVKKHSIETLFRKSEMNSLYGHIQNLGISAIASFCGFKAKEIIRYRKCELCEKIFNDPETLNKLIKETGNGLNSCYK